jgi:class 3 adenylate cyclase
MDTQWRVLLLGGLRAEQHGGRTVSRFRTQKTGALLAYLAYHRQRTHLREVLIELLWPEADVEAGRNSLNTAISWLRRQLEPPGAVTGAVLVTGRNTVQLNPTAVTTDVAEFEASLAAAVSAASSAARAEHLIEAAEPYRGELLPDHCELWILPEREWLAQRYLEALRQIMAYLEQAGDFQRALEYAYRGVRADPLREEAHCELIRLLAVAGQPDAATRQYRELERLLKLELDASPGPAARALLREIERLAAVQPLTPRSLKPVSARAAGPRADAQHQPSRQQALETGQLEGENRLVTVLFADMSRSVEITQDLHPEDAAALVNRLLQRMIDTLLKYEGRVDRFLGDGVLAVFGMHPAHEDDPERAIRAALEIREAARKLGLEVRTGINTGEVYFGVMGSEQHQEVTVMGPVVNLASRLQEQAGPGQVLIGETTCRLTRRAFEFSPSSLPILGFTTPVAAYAVERALPRPEKTRGIEGLHAPLIGRDEELAKLEAVLTQGLAGRGQMVSLIGEAGVGKSRLVSELKAAHCRSASLWLEGRCLQLGMSTGYSLFADLFTDHFAWGPDEDEPERAARIAASLQALVVRGHLDVERAREIGPFLGNLLSLRAGNEWDLRLESMPPEQLRHQTFLAIRDFFVALGRSSPVILVLEDLHWADSLSLDILPLLMESLGQAPLVLLCVYRPERDHRCWHLATQAERKCPEQYTELRLRELTPLQSHRLVESLLDMATLPAGVQNRILEKARGNPFFVEELVRSLIDAGELYRDGEVWQAREGKETVAVPESLQSVILSRVDHLEPELKEVLQSASVIGRLFRRRWLASMLGKTPDTGPGTADAASELEQALWTLEERGLLYRERMVPEEEYSFKHVLTQETIYHGLLRHQRAALHQKVAVMIETLHGDALETYLEELAHHYERSGEDEKTQERALDYLTRAAGRARRAAAHREEAALLTRAMSLAERLGQHALVAELHGQRGAAFACAGMFTEARQELETALLGMAPERREQRATVLADLTHACFLSFDLPSVGLYADEALALALAVGREDLAVEAMGAVAMAAGGVGDMPSCIDHFETAVAMAGKVDNPRIARSLHLYSNVLYWLGQADAGVRHGHRMVKMAYSANDTFTLIWALPALGLCLMGAGAYEEALGVFQEAQRIGREQEVWPLLARAIAMSAGIHLEMFDYAGHEAVVRQARELARSARFAPAEVSAGIDLLLNFARSGQVGQAEALVEEVARVVTGAGGWHGWLWRLRLAEARAEIALAREDWETALRWAESAIEQSRVNRRVKYEVLGLVSRSQAVAARGRTRAAIADLQTAVALARPIGDPALFLRASTALLAIAGDQALASEARATARQISAALPDDDLCRSFEAAGPVRLLGDWKR